jgi:YggT family protein
VQHSIIWEIVCILLFVFWLILITRIILSIIPLFAPIPYSGPMRRITDFVYAVTEPVLRPLRRVLPAIRMGAVALDLSPIIVFIVIGVLRTAIGC